MDQSRFFIIGANGQLGRALQARYPGAQAGDVEMLDITDRASVQNFDWSKVSVVLNAAAYTNVDGAESPEGRVLAWKINAQAMANLAEVAREHDLTLVHISTDYVFDGTQAPHTETEDFSPLSAYGASKAAGDLIVSQLPKHYILRTSWVIGEGKNFVRTMLGVGQKGVSPSVVSDQIGRLTFTNTLVDAIDHLLSKVASFGTYNVSNGGEPASWAEITREIYSAANLPDIKVTDTTTAEYFKDKPEAAPRPLNSTLDMGKIESTGFSAPDWRSDLLDYVRKELDT